ncbi:STAS domain-containing protein [Actinoplanes sp. NPDC049681]|uniref:STAS domain-containing protein n=1 Tax=Actinoplanes sp. NPDC049681 TaxID=3363905 RepID=UPI0037895526
MDVRKREAGEIVILSLSGDLDGRVPPETQNEIVQALPPHRRVLLELSGLGTVTSAGLRTMLQIYRQAQALDVTVALVGLSDQLRNVLTATGFLSFFTVGDSVEEGLARLADPVPQGSGAR